MRRFAKSVSDQVCPGLKYWSQNIFYFTFEFLQKLFLPFTSQDIFGFLPITHRITIKQKFLLKTVAFIAGKSENQAAKKIFIRFSIDNLIANISLYALSWPKLNFGSFEIIFKL